jgi:hypothetical protein
MRLEEGRTVDSILFRTGGTAAPATSGNGFLFDNLSQFSGIEPVGPPAGVEGCKQDGWKAFNAPRTFKSQGDCLQYVKTGK